MRENGSGFTLIEILVVISVIGIIFTIGVAAYNQFARRQLVNQTSQELRNNLRLAQSKALAGEKPQGCLGHLNGYQVNFSANSYTVAALCDSLVTIGTYNLPSNVAIAGPSSILFKVLGRGTEVTGALPVVISGFDQTNWITVESAGGINLTGATPTP